VRVGSVVAVVGQNSAQRVQTLQVCHATLTAGGLGLGLTEQRDANTLRTGFLTGSEGDDIEFVFFARPPVPWTSVTSVIAVAPTAPGVMPSSACAWWRTQSRGQHVEGMGGAGPFPADQSADLGRRGSSRSTRSRSVCTGPGRRRRAGGPVTRSPRAGHRPYCRRAGEYVPAVHPGRRCSAGRTHGPVR
jgi:hypothetical protein